jgi:ATP adenylyltransferase
MGEIDGLAFYNAGQAAGASEPHKHLQLVPLPLDGEGRDVPMEPLLDAAQADAQPDRAPGLPFEHSFVRLSPVLFAAPSSTPQILAENYRALLHAAGIQAVPGPHGLQQSSAYNLLLTRRWMLLVPRTREHCDAISVNALGYAGSLFVRDEAQLALVQSRGPLAILASVARAVT